MGRKQTELSRKKTTQPAKGDLDASQDSGQPDCVTSLTPQALHARIILLVLLEGSKGWGGNLPA